MNIFSLLERFERKQLLVALAVLLAVLVGLRVLAMQYLAYKAGLENELENLQLQYYNLRRIVDQSKEFASLNTGLKRLQKEVVRDHFIPGESRALAKAQFQHLIQGLADKAGINIRTIKILSDQVKEQFVVLQLQLSARGEIGAIQNFLMALKHDPRYFWVQVLEIKRISRRENRFFYVSAQVAGLASR